MDEADELGNPFLLHVGGFADKFRVLAQHLCGDEARKFAGACVVEGGECLLFIVGILQYTLFIFQSFQPERERTGTLLIKIAGLKRW